MDSFCNWGTRSFPRGRVLQWGYGVDTGYRVNPVGRYSIDGPIRDHLDATATLQPGPMSEAHTPLRVVDPAMPRTLQGESARPFGQPPQRGHPHHLVEGAPQRVRLVATQPHRGVAGNQPRAQRPRFRQHRRWSQHPE